MKYLIIFYKDGSFRKINTRLFSITLMIFNNKKVHSFTLFKNKKDRNKLYDIIKILKIK